MAAAKKLKQIVELTDPTPVDVVLPKGAVTDAERDYGADEKEVVAEATVGTNGVDGGEKAS